MSPRPNSNWLATDSAATARATASALPLDAWLSRRASACSSIAPSCTTARTAGSESLVAVAGGGAMGKSAAARFVVVLAPAPAPAPASASSFSTRATIESGKLSRPDGVSPLTFPASRVTFETTIRRPFLRTIVSAWEAHARNAARANAAATFAEMFPQQLIVKILPVPGHGSAASSSAFVQTEYSGARHK